MSHASSKSKQNTELHHIKQQIEVYTRKVAHEKTRLEEINEKIVQHELNAFDQKRQVGGGDDFNDNRVKKVETAKKLLIDRLNKKLIALNKQISQNVALRKTIDEMVTTEIRRKNCPIFSLFHSLSHIHFRPHS